MIVFAQFALFLVIGVMLFVYAQHASLPVAGGDADRIFPEFIVRDMPVGLRGIVLASIFAIAMSNASGSLNSLASSSVIDLSPRMSPSCRNRATRFSAPVTQNHACLGRSCLACSGWFTGVRCSWRD